MKYFLTSLLFLLNTSTMGLEAFSARYRLSLDHQPKGETYFNLKLTGTNSYSLEAYTQPEKDISLEDGTNEILESSRGYFDFSRVTPESYYYAVRKKTGTRILEFFFDWKNRQVLFRDQQVQEKFKLEEGAQDSLSYLLQAMILPAQAQREHKLPRLSVAGQQQFTLSKKLKRYISTPAGRYLAQQIEITVEGESKPRQLWLAVNKGYLPLLLEKPTPVGLVKMELMEIR